MVAPNPDDQVRYDILIEAQAALKSLQELLRLTADNREKIIQFSDVVLKHSKDWGVSWQQALNVYKQLNAELSKQKKANLFGPTGGQNLIQGSEQYLQALDNAGRLQDKVGKGGEEMGDKIERGTQKASRGMRILNIALGTLEAMFLFRLLNAVETFFRSAIENAQKFELTLYRLREVEKTLSMEGIEISMKGLQQGIKDIQKLLPIFSKEDIAEMIGGLAISTKELGLSEKQIIALGKAISILNVNSTQTETLLQTQQHVVTSLLTGNARGVSQLGLSFSEVSMKAKAAELGIIKVGDSLEGLTDKQKAQIKFAIIMDVAGIGTAESELEKVAGVLDTNFAKLEENKAAWSDLGVTIGQVILPLLPALTGFFKLIRDGFNGGKVLIIEFLTYLGTLAGAITAVYTGQVRSVREFLEFVKFANADIRENFVNQFFKEMPEDAPKWFTDNWGKLIKEEADTATSGLNELNEAAQELDAEIAQKIEDIANDAMDAREDLNIRLKERIEDLAIKLRQKLEDLDIEYLRKTEDAARDYADKIEDINLDAAQAVEDAKNKARDDEKKNEEEHLLRLKHLREDYLLNLEEALHARDARAVLRLMKQYKLDKQQLIEKYELDKKYRAEALQADLKRIEIERQRRLAEAQREYQEKLADLARAKQRELEEINRWQEREVMDLQRWYQREQEEIERNVQRKLEALIKGYIEEQKITEANAQTVYGILLKYFGPGGMTDGIYQYMMNSLLQAAQTAIAVAQSYNPFSTVGTSTVGGAQTGGRNPTKGGSAGGGGKKMAEGGALLATRPTTVTFGEAGAEIGMFMPVGRPGRDVGRVFASGGDGQGVNGKIVLDLFLSPDLEARVMENTMDGVAQVITKVHRSKV